MHWLRLPKVIKNPESLRPMRAWAMKQGFPCFLDQKAPNAGAGNFGVAHHSFAALVVTGAEMPL